MSLCFGVLGKAESKLASSSSAVNYCILAPAVSDLLKTSEPNR